jgi:transposase
LSPTDTPERVIEVEPTECRGCGSGLVDGVADGFRTVQEFDIPPVELTVTEYRLIRRRCPDCGTATAAEAPAGVSGPVCYGANVRAAATLLAAEGFMSVERTAAMMSALLAAPVSTGFVSRCLARLAENLAGFEDQLKRALRAAPVLHTDETPANVPAPGAHHVFTVRTAELVWYGAADNRGHRAIDGFGLLPGYPGTLVRDDYGGYTKYDVELAGVQLCCAHLLRDLQGVIDLDPGTQQWAEAVAGVLREAATAAEQARTAGQGAVHPDRRAEQRGRYDQAVLAGISANLSRRWVDGKNHPGLVLARRLQAKADQVWTFTADTRVPWTNNAAESALRMVKLRMKIAGCWRSLATAHAFCRIRSYLTSARNHDVTPLAAIHNALTATPWMPPTNGLNTALRPAAP